MRAHTQTHSGRSNLASDVPSKFKKTIKIGKIVQNSTRTHAGRHADEGDAPSVRLLSEIITTAYGDSGICVLIVTGRNPLLPLS